MTKYSVEYLDKDFYMWFGRGSRDNIPDAVEFFNEVKKDTPHHIVRLVCVMMEHDPQNLEESEKNAQ